MFEKEQPQEGKNNLSSPVSHLPVFDSSPSWMSTWMSVQWLSSPNNSPVATRVHMYGRPGGEGVYLALAYLMLLEAILPTDRQLDFQVWSRIGRQE